MAPSRAPVALGADGREELLANDATSRVDPGEKLRGRANVAGEALILEFSAASVSR